GGATAASSPWWKADRAEMGAAGPAARREEGEYSPECAVSAWISPAPRRNPNYFAAVVAWVWAVSFAGVLASAPVSALPRSGRCRSTSTDRTAERFSSRPTVL